MNNVTNSFELLATPPVAKEESLSFDNCLADQDANHGFTV